MSDFAARRTQHISGDAIRAVQDDHPFEVMADDPEHVGRQKAVIKQKATSCDLCTHLKEPSCVYACPHDAAHRVDPREFFAEILAAGAVK